MASPSRRGVSVHYNMAGEVVAAASGGSSGGGGGRVGWGIEARLCGGGGRGGQDGLWFTLLSIPPSRSLPLALTDLCFVGQGERREG